ncbi:MAG: hypothetical protein GY854_27240 [Deltaproteobacteria bacterium]|nr:hypothetical protein [Deltaproteobacteria bacterium]
MKTAVIRFFAVSLAIIFFVAGIGELRAGIEGRFAGKIFILKKRPPSYFKSQGAFASFLRKNSIKKVEENEDNEWMFRTFAFFKRKLGDYEVDMVFYNVNRGSSKSQRVFVDTFTQMTQDRNTRSLEGKCRLTRPSFDANIDYMIVAQNAGKELAKGFFRTRGMSQAAIDQQKRFEHEQKEMEKSMKDLEAKAKAQEEDERLRAQGIDPDAKKKSERSEDDDDEGEEGTDHPGEVDPRANPRGCSMTPLPRDNISLFEILATIL